MKLSQTLLNAVFIGMTSAAVVSCTGLTDTVAEVHEMEQCTDAGCGDDDGGVKNTWENCIACGMG